MSPLMTSWAKSWKKFDEMALELARDNWDDARIRVIAGKNRKWDTLKFEKADLQGAVNMLIDYNGLFPKSNATQRATVGQMAQLGMINPQDPEQNFKILEIFGETELKPSWDLDVKDATREQDMFLSDPTYMPQIRPQIDNDTIHLLYHTNFAKTDEFWEMDTARQDVWYEHIDATVANFVQRRQALQSMGLDPDSPGMEEITGGQAAVAAATMQGIQEQQMAAAGQNGGVANGAEGPDARLDGSGAKHAGSTKPDAQPGIVPDIAGGGQAPPGAQA